ncbi:MAG: hypothetical protein Q7K57_12780 [Burkholderiaceae bacterium]|nr:hypothetical protein [Burkholderiaceae bacterium]
MKTFEQLAASAYHAYSKQAGGKDYVHHPLPTYDKLSPEMQACWVAAVKQVAAEIAAIH